MIPQDDKPMRDRRAETLDAGDAALLLPLAVYSTDRPIDVLIERVGRDDGGEWLSNAIGHFGDNQKDLPSLLAVRDAAIQSLARAFSSEEVAEASARYVFSVAAALTSHGQSITSASPMELADACIMLSVATTNERWREMFDRAANRWIGLATSGGRESDAG